MILSLLLRRGLTLSSLAVGLACGRAADPADLAAAPARPANQITRNDFEAVAGWGAGETPASLTTDQAHSGRYSIRVGPDVEYSYTYKLPLRLALPTRPARLRVRGWFYRAAAGRQGALIVEIRLPDGKKSSLYQSVSLADLPVGTWTERTTDVDVPAEATSLDDLIVYLWRAGSPTPLYLDDVEITALP